MNINTVFSFFPIVLLIWLMTKKKGMPSHKALPLSALAVCLISFFIFKNEPVLICTNIIIGLLEAWKPIFIIAGAVFLFKTMEATGSILVVKKWLNNITENQVAQLMIVGWAFPFLLEGASGFGTPGAIATPILVGLGYKPIKVAILYLLMNTVAVSFGAVGTPIWYGFSALPEAFKLAPSELFDITFKTATIHSLIALFIVVFALFQILSFKTILKNGVFVILSVFCTVAPYWFIARFDYEFPSLIGGGIGLLASVFIANRNIGLEKVDISNSPKKEKVKTVELIKATFPLWGTIFLLIITRIPYIGIKSLLRLKEPSIGFSIDSLGDFSISSSLVVGLKNILGTSGKWSHELLFIPSLIPFILISFITFILYRSSNKKITKAIKSSLFQMEKPTLALLGALVFVSLMMMGGNDSPVNQVGNILAGFTGYYWSFFASYLGAIGAFFSGSATISNLTFVGIQNSIALETGLDRTTILALQSVGGSFGNMICINSIVAVTSVLGLENKEGYILKKTILPAIFYGLLAGIIAVLLF